MFWPVLVVLLLLQLPACHRPSHEQPADARSVSDDLGRAVRVEGEPARIVSLAPSLTEMLFVLGAGARVVGVTSYCDFPAEAKQKTVVGDLLTPDIERIVSLRPDLVLISVEGNSQRSFIALEQLGVRIFVSNPRDVAGVYKSLRDIGALIGEKDRASALVDSLQRAEAQLREGRSAGKPGVLMLLSLQPLMAAGGNTFINEVITLAGGRNAAGALSGNYPTLNREILLRLNPDLILYPDDMGVDETQLDDGFPEWKQLGAMQRGAMYRIDADRFLRPGPRVFEAAEELQIGRAHV